MASPFHLFRKYQKSFLVVAGVLAMFIFVVADPLMSWLQSSSGGSGGPRSGATVVATWDGGSLNVRQLDTLSQRRYKISEFLSNLVGLAAGIIEQEGGSPLPPSLPDFRLQPDTDARAVQVGCVTTRVLAELASRSGITISDQVINHYLREWGLRRMGDAEIATILGRLGMSDKVLFAGLRELMLGNFYVNSYMLATRGVMPEERWQDWKRINERIAVQAALLPTEKFLDAVPEPSETELRDFYEQHKQQIAGLPEIVMGAQLPSPNPGFREPRRVKLQYLLGSVDDWTQKLLNDVTEQEIGDYYERNKRTQFIKSSATSSTGLFDEQDGGTEFGSAEDETGDQERGASEVDTDSEMDAETDTGDAEKDESEAVSEPGTVPAAPVGPTFNDSPTGDTGSAGEQAEEDQPAGDEAADEEPDVDESKSSRAGATSPFRLAALQVDATDEQAAADSSESSTDTEIATDISAETAPKLDESDAEQAVVADEAIDAATAGDASETVSYEPLDNVREQIRRSLARDRAVVELQKVVDRTYASLQSVYNPYGFQVVTARTEATAIPAPPAELSDYVAIAKRTGLASEETVTLSQVELADTYVGKAFDAQSRREFVVQAMFGDQELYEPYRAIDLDGNAYIVCKVEDVPSSVPPFEDVQDKVLAAWKQQQAAQLALAKAKELATQAESSGETVAALARSGGYETVTTDMFSWLTFGTTQAELQRGPRLGDAPPLTAVGIDFMTEVFDLKPEEKTALLNHDHSSAYLLQLDRREMTEAEMRQQFLAEANSWYGGRVMNSARWGASQRQLLGQLSEQTGLNLDKLEEFLSVDSE